MTRHQRNLAQERHAQSCAVSRAPPWPKMAWLEPQSGQVNMDMFSTTPRIGTWVLLNMVMPFLASIRAMSCGVETITAPFSGTRWAMVSWASPVPGGMSSTSTSSGAHGDIAQHLRQRALHHRSAPDHGFVFLDQKTDATWS